jgi:transcriptional regulator with XRE-family HTH domain
MSFQEQLSLFQDQEYRESYLETQVCSGIAYQIQALRHKDGSSQKEFAAKIDKPQSVVSRLENTEYGKVSVRTLLDVAGKLDVALVVKFVSYPKFLDEYDDLTSDNLAVETIKESLSAPHRGQMWTISSQAILEQVINFGSLDYSKLTWTVMTSPIQTIDSDCEVL